MTKRCSHTAHAAAAHHPTAYRGDPGIAHTGDNAFVTWMGGCWGFVAIDKIRHIIEPRPMFNPAVMLAAAEERAFRRTGKSKRFEEMKKNGSYKAREDRANKVRTPGRAISNIKQQRRRRVRGTGTHSLLTRLPIPLHLRR